MIRHHSTIIAAVFLSVVFCMATGCEKLFTGVGPQPVYLDTSPFEPRLNVLGVLRPDYLEGFPQSFVYLEQSRDILDDEGAWEITDADVTVSTLQADTTADSLKFVYTDMDSVFSFKAFRHRDFIPEGGEKYLVACRKQGMTPVQAVVQIPRAVVIKPQSEKLEDGRLSFTILRDETAFLYEIILYIEGDPELYTETIRRPDSGDIEVSILLNDMNREKTGILLVYVYDRNFAEYKSYNVSIKPNTFRSDYSTLDSAYGCIGGINVLEKEVQF